MSTLDNQPKRHKEGCICETCCDKRLVRQAEEAQRMAHNKQIFASYSDEKLRQFLWDHTGGTTIVQGHGKPNKGINDLSRQELLDLSLALTGGI